MAIQLIIDGQTYNYPANKDDPGWGEDATAWAQAVTDALASILSPGDILLQSFNLLDDVSVASDITNFFFDPLSVRTAIAEYSIYRVAGLTERVEGGTLIFTYSSLAGTWVITEYGGDGPGGITFSITNSGQVQYVSDAMGVGHTGVLKFRARALPQ